MVIRNTVHLKHKVHNACIAMIQEQLDTVQSSLDQLMEAKNNETKSSAGDKYETGMAMIQNQEELYKRQQAEAKNRMFQLQQINPDGSSAFIDKGSLVELSIGFFYLSVAIGKIEVETTTVFALSLESPLGTLLKSKKEGESISLNGKKIPIVTMS